MKVQIEPQINGGMDVYHFVTGGSTNAINIKSGPSQVFGWYMYNSNAAARKINFHDMVGNPTAGTSIVKLAVMIPPTSGANVFSDIGIQFSKGIAITTVTGIADTDATVVTANDLSVNIFYK